MTARPEWARRVTGLLHAYVCQGQSWNADCRREDGGRHGRDTMRPTVMNALRQPDPIAYLHDITCSAMLDSTAGSCPERDRHIAHMTGILGRPA